MLQCSWLLVVVPPQCLYFDFMVSPAESLSLLRLSNCWNVCLTGSPSSSQPSNFSLTEHSSSSCFSRFFLSTILCVLSVASFWFSSDFFDLPCPRCKLVTQSLLDLSHRFADYPDTKWRPHTVLQTIQIQNDDHILSFCKILTVKSSLLMAANRNLRLSADKISTVHLHSLLLLAHDKKKD